MRKTAAMVTQATPWVWIVALALGIAADRLFLALSSEKRSMVLTAIGLVAIAFLAAIPWLVGIRRGQVDVLELVYPFSLLYFVEFGGRALWIVLRPEAFASQTPHPSVIQSALVPALFVAALGFAAYLAAYYAFRRRDPGHGAANAGTPTRFPAWTVLLVYGAGFLVRLPFLLLGWFMSFAAASFAQEVPAALHSLGYLSLLGTIGYTMAFVAYMQPGRPSWFGWVLWGVILPLETLYAFLSGSKFALLNLICIPLVVRHYLVRPLRPRTLVLIGVAFLFVAVPLVAVYRLVASPETLRLTTFGSGLPALAAAMARRLLGFSWREYLGASVGVALSRFIGTDALASVIAAIPVLTQFQFGNTLTWIARILIPTALWPDKYLVLMETLSPVPMLFGFADFSRGGLSITLPGELYWNFGAIGVGLGMAAIGLFHRWIVVTFRRPHSPARIALYALVWVWVALSFEGWFYATYANILRILFIGWAVGWMAMRLVRPQHTPEHAAV